MNRPIRVPMDRSCYDGRGSTSAIGIHPVSVLDRIATTPQILAPFCPGMIARNPW